MLRRMCEWSGKNGLTEWRTEEWRTFESGISNGKVKEQSVAVGNYHGMAMLKV